MHRDQIKAFPGNVDLHLEALAELRHAPSLFDVVQLPTSGGCARALEYRPSQGHFRRPWVRQLFFLFSVAVDVTAFCLPVTLICLFGADRAHRIQGLVVAAGVNGFALILAAMFTRLPDEPDVG